MSTHFEFSSSISRARCICLEAAKSQCIIRYDKSASEMGHGEAAGYGQATPSIVKTGGVDSDMPRRYMGGYTLIVAKSRYEIGLMREAGVVVAGCHAALADFIKPGITTLQIDEFVDSFITRHHMEPAQKGYKGYPFAACTSVNDVICHGFPSSYVLAEGDIITVDMVALHKGVHADSAWSYAIGDISPEARHLMDVTKMALFKGIEQAIIGNQISDIGHAIQTYVESEKLAVVRDYIGHGIGRDMHESPEILHYGPPHKGPRIKKGMTFTIEPMVNTGTYETALDDDGWTARTADGGLSIQYEHTLAITEDGPEILTQL